MRISGVNIPDEKQIGAGLTAVFGIGRNLSHSLLKELNIDPITSINKLAEEDITKIRDAVAKNRIEGDLRSEVQQNIKHKINVQSYQGIRHLKKLPLRGQKTKTNARTKRGKKVTVGSGRKAPAQKT